MISPDAQLSIWITELAGRVSFIDEMMRLLASDFFMPVSMSLVLLFLWFGTRDPVQRSKHQYGAICASASLGFANLAVYILNKLIQFNPWPRPFEIHESAARAVEIIFYMPHDASFPANIAAITFGVAMGMWFYSRKASHPLFLIAVVWSFARVYAGVHYPLDILGGAVIGAAVAWGTYGIIRLLWPFPAACLRVAKKLYVA